MMTAHMRSLEKAQIVYERTSGFHEAAGPYEGGRIGFRWGDRVFWTDAFSFPGDTTETYRRKENFAAEIVRRLNQASSDAVPTKEGQS